MAKRGFIHSHHRKILLCISLLSVSCFTAIQAVRYVSHTSVSTDVEIIDGKQFCHSISSSNGVVSHEFSIDRVPVQQDDFYKALDFAYAHDLRKERQVRIKNNQSRIAFIDDCNRAILEKSIKSIVFKSQQLFDLLSNESIKPYLKFGDTTVQSFYQLTEMKKYIDAADAVLKDNLKKQDIDNLQEMLKKIEQWPDRLHACFKSSIESAIAQCDDTLMLKELLNLIAAL